MQQLNNSLDADLPSKREDSFNRQHFAQFVLSTIKQCPVGSSFVVGIEGEWGSGKTFVFEQIKTLIAARRDENAEFGVCTIDYSPWLVSGKHAIVQELLRALSMNLWTKHTLFGGGEKIAKLIGQFAGALGAAGSVAVGGIDFGLIAMVSRDVSKKAKQVESFLKPNESPQHLKGEIVKALAKVNEKTVVFIDDIDRLPPAEIRDLFQAIKSVADFPNVIYVLGYDRKIVTNSLKDTASDFDGVHYLEKIVQLPMPLRRIGEREHVAFLVKQLESLSYDFSKSDSERIRGVLIACGRLIKTPRMAVRLCNSLRMLKKQLDGEVDAVDLLAIELLRFAEPDVWQYIHDQTQLYTGVCLPTDYQSGVDYREHPQEHAAQQALARDKNQADLNAKAAIKTCSSATQSLHRLLFPDAFDDKGGSFRNRDSNPRLLSNRDRLAYYFSQSGTNWVFPIRDLQNFVTLAGMKSFFVSGTCFDFCYRAEKALEVKNELTFENPMELLSQIAQGLSQFSPSEFVKNQDYFHSNSQFEFVGEIILELLNGDSSFTSEQLKGFLAALPFNYICYFQSKSSIHGREKAKGKQTIYPVCFDSLQEDTRYQSSVNDAFLAAMRAQDAPQKLIAYGQNIAENFDDYAKLSSLIEARDLFSNCCKSSDFLQGLPNQPKGHDQYSRRFFKFVDDHEAFVQRFTSLEPSSEAIVAYLGYLQSDETKALWQSEHTKGMEVSD